MLNKMRINANEKGFTLIELMIVIAIIGILAAIAVPNFIAFRDKGYCSAAESDARSLGAALADYFSIPTNVSFAKNGTRESTDQEFTFSDNNKVKLSNKNTAEIEGVTDTNSYVIRVDESVTGRCPDDYMDGNPRWDTATHVYSYTI